MGEVELALLLCSFLAGSENETRHYFDVNQMKRYVRVDCETRDHVIEVGLDQKSSSRDSVHQALFYAHLSRKSPVVVIIDRDGLEGRYEYELRRVSEMAGVTYLRCSESAIQRWAATSGLRSSPQAMGLHDLPQQGGALTACDLNKLRQGQHSGAGM